MPWLHVYEVEPFQKTESLSTRKKDESMSTFGDGGVRFRSGSKAQRSASPRYTRPRSDVTLEPGVISANSGPAVPLGSSLFPFHSFYVKFCYVVREPRALLRVQARMSRPRVVSCPLALVIYLIGFLSSCGRYEGFMNLPSGCPTWHMPLLPAAAHSTESIFV
jgi:hypothetical protein